MAIGSYSSKIMIMDGILLIDKPEGFTSHDVVAKLRRVLKTRKIGHTGTLDPFATGVLVMLVGKATRLAQFLDKDEKGYEALVRFGFATDTGDRTGEKISDNEASDEAVRKALAEADWEEVLSRFRGQIEQTPPMYSAKKIDGQKLYELARKGEVVERKAVSIFIERVEISAGPDDLTRKLGIGCSAGTYIRTLAEDIGKAIGLGAHLTELRRTRAGRFYIADSILLDKLEEMQDPAAALLPIELAVEHLPEVKLNAERSAKTRNGLSTRVHEVNYSAGEFVRMIDDNNELIAIGSFDPKENVIQPKVVLG
ncbi:tRNA pseudouridine(55) synthase TruB [soil metagenome]